MIEKMMNLRCTKGHLHFSPNPKAWVGQECMRVIGQSEKDRPIKCRAKIRRWNGVRKPRRNKSTKR